MCVWISQIHLIPRIVFRSNVIEMCAEAHVSSFKKHKGGAVHAGTKTYHPKSTRSEYPSFVSNVCDSSKVVLRGFKCMPTPGDDGGRSYTLGEINGRAGKDSIKQVTIKCPVKDCRHHWVLNAGRVQRTISSFNMKVEQTSNVPASYSFLNSPRLTEKKEGSGQPKYSGSNLINGLQVNVYDHHDNFHSDVPPYAMVQREGDRRTFKSETDFVNNSGN